MHEDSNSESRDLKFSEFTSTSYADTPYEPLKSNPVKRKRHECDHDDVEEMPMVFKKSTYYRMKYLEHENEELKEENAALKEEIRRLRENGSSPCDEILKIPAAPRLRAHRPTPSDLNKLTILHNGEMVLISSLYHNELLQHLEGRRLTMGSPPIIKGLEHTEIVAKLGSDLIKQLSLHPTKGFGYHLAAYFMTKEAFLSCYFKPFTAHNGNAHPKNGKRCINDFLASVLRYYALFFGGILFDNDPHLQDLWFTSLQSSLNQKVDHMNADARKGKSVNYYQFSRHTPPFDPQTAFDEENT